MIGTSTGGPDALAVVLPGLPGDLPVPVLVVQHMPPLFTQLLAARLDEKSGLHVVEAAGNDAPAAGGAWIAPGNFHMIVDRAGPPAHDVRIALNRDAPESSCRPAVDPLLRSAARVWGPGVLAVIMTGMGQDGSRGCEAVLAAGGQVIAQDKESSIVWGMPGSVVEQGLADAVVPLDRIAAEIVRRVMAGRHAAPLPGAAGGRG